MFKSQRPIFTTRYSNRAAKIGTALCQAVLVTMMVAVMLNANAWWPLAVGAFPNLF